MKNFILVFLFVLTLGGCAEEKLLVCQNSLSKENLLFGLKSNQTPTEANLVIPHSHYHIKDLCTTSIKPKVYVETAPNFSFKNYTGILTLEYYNNRLMTTNFEFTTTHPPIQVERVVGGERNTHRSSSVNKEVKCYPKKEKGWICDYYAVDMRLLGYLKKSEY